MTRPFASANDEAVEAADPQQTFEMMLDEVLIEIRTVLLAKNRAYGNSVLDPINIFCKGGPLAQIDARIDDKLSRISRGHAADEDVELDLTGYLLIRRIARQFFQADKR
ncbi:MAG: hypothetical protein AAFQ35_07345 [Pseudomonadota bacterium]